MPKIESKRARREDRRDRDRGDRGDYNSREDGRSERKSFRDDHLQSYRIEVGEFHGAQKGDIVGAIANEVGLDPRSVGKIRMFKDHSFIDLPQDMPKEILDALKTVWVQGHQMNISIDKGRPRPGGKGGKFKKSFGKGKKFGKGRDFKKKSKPSFRS
jgi:ATP-dependent RNA helicase DeaD